MHLKDFCHLQHYFALMSTLDSTICHPWSQPAPVLSSLTWNCDAWDCASWSGCSAWPTEGLAHDSGISIDQLWRDFDSGHYDEMDFINQSKSLGTEASWLKIVNWIIDCWIKTKIIILFASRYPPVIYLINSYRIIHI